MGRMTYILSLSFTGALDYLQTALHASRRGVGKAQSLTVARRANVLNKHKTTKEGLLM